MKLEHALQYITHDVQYAFRCAIDADNDYDSLLTLAEIYSVVNQHEYLLILHPFSDLTKQIEIGGKSFIPMVELLKIKSPYDDYDLKYGLIEIDPGIKPKAYYKFRANIEIIINTAFISDEPYWLVQKLIEWHFDVFNLLDQRKAFDINKLTK